MRVRSWTTPAALAGLLLAAGLRADDSSQLLAQQKQTAAANWKKLEKKEQPPAETALLLLYSELPEAKAKALAAALDKQASTAVKALKLGKDDVPWKGKLVVYFFPERDDFTSFIRTVEARRPSPDESSSSVVSGDTPHLAVGPGRSSATSEEVATQELVKAVLKKKTGDFDIPEWVAIGFRKATVYRSSAAGAGKGPNGPWKTAFRNYPVNQLWDPNAPAGSARDDAAAYVMDYLAYGPGAEKFGEFLTGIRPDDAKPTKTIEDALTALKVAPADFLVALQRWGPLPKPKK